MPRLWYESSTYLWHVILAITPGASTVIISAPPVIVLSPISAVGLTGIVLPVHRIGLLRLEAHDQNRLGGIADDDIRRP